MDENHVLCFLYTTTATVEQGRFYVDCSVCGETGKSLLWTADNKSALAYFVKLGWTFEDRPVCPYCNGKPDTRMYR